MRVGHIADWHLWNHLKVPGPSLLGMNERFRNALAVAGRLRSLGLDELVIAGDVYDGPRPSPQMLWATMEELSSIPYKHVILGNHDQASLEHGDNALAPFMHAEGWTIYEQPVFRGGWYYIPYGHDPLTLRPPKGTQVVVAHHGIFDETTDHRWKSDSSRAHRDILKWCDLHNIPYYFAGDWHVHKSWNDGRIQQIGAFVPTGWDNPGFDGYGTVIVIDTDEVENGRYKMERWFLEGPRFLKAESRALAYQMHDDLLVAGYNPYIKVTGGEPAPVEPDYNIIYEPDVDEHVSAQEVASAAQTLRSGGRQLELIRGYVDSRPTIEPELRDEVFDMVASYVQRG